MKTLGHSRTRDGSGELPLGGIGELPSPPVDAGLEGNSGTSFVDVDGMEHGLDLDLNRHVFHKRFLQVLRARGITRLRPVQAVAIKEGLFYRRSLLVSSPSGSGKTLIGELAAMYSVFENFGKAAYLVPLKALAMEKYKHFVKWYSPFGVKVEISIGDYDIPPEDLVLADVIVMTYEKMDSMIRSMGTRLCNLFGCVVIDEIHVMGELGRGPRLESLIVRLGNLLGDVQIVGLSATIANPVEVNGWLVSLGHESRLILSRKRPVPLKYEFVLSNNDLRVLREIVEDTLEDGGQCLLFARSRKKAENLARLLAGTLARFLPDEKRGARMDIALRIKNNNRLSELPPLVYKGIAYHHAGLSRSERELVEHAFKQRVIGVICCTTTLSAGINLPARTVILQDFKQYTTGASKVDDKSRFVVHPNFPNKRFAPIPRNTFHQILGRAGRAGFDEEGRCYVIARSSEEIGWIKRYYFDTNPDGTLVPRYDPLVSMLSNRDTMLEQLLVAVHESKIITMGELSDFFRKTYYTFSRENDGLPVDTILQIKHISARDIAASVNGANQEGWTMELVHASKDRLAGRVETPGGVYECQVSDAGHASCKCLPEDADGLERVCTHLRFLIHHVLVSYPGLAAHVDRMLVNALNRECHVDYLCDNGFILPAGPDLFSCSSFGALVAKLYVSPRIAVFIKEKIIEHCSSQSMPGRQVKVPSITSPVQEDDTVKSRPPSSLPSPDVWLFGLTKEVLAISGAREDHSLFIAAWHWINEEPLETILEPWRKPVPELREFKQEEGRVYPGDFNNFKKNLARWVRIVAKIAEHVHALSVVHVASVMEARLSHGVKEELLPLVTGIKGVGRIRGRLLFKAGYHSVNDVMVAEPDVMASKTLLPLQICNRIIEAARSIEDEDGPDHDRIRAGDVLGARNDGSNEGGVSK